MDKDKVGYTFATRYVADAKDLADKEFVAGYDLCDASKIDTTVYEVNYGDMKFTMDQFNQIQSLETLKAKIEADKKDHLARMKQRKENKAEDYFKIIKGTMNYDQLKALQAMLGQWIKTLEIKRKES